MTAHHAAIGNAARAGTPIRMMAIHALAAPGPRTLGKRNGRRLGGQKAPALHLNGCRTGIDACDDADRVPGTFGRRGAAWLRLRLHCAQHQSAAMRRQSSFSDTSRKKRLTSRHHRSSGTSMSSSGAYCCEPNMSVAGAAARRHHALVRLTLREDDIEGDLIHAGILADERSWRASRAFLFSSSGARHVRRKKLHRMIVSKRVITRRVRVETFHDCAVAHSPPQRFLCRPPNGNSRH